MKYGNDNKDQKMPRDEFNHKSFIEEARLVRGEQIIQEQSNTGSKERKLSEVEVVLSHISKPVDSDYGNSQPDQRGKSFVEDLKAAR